MKVKIFASTNALRLQDEVNEWLAGVPDGVVITSTDTAASERATQGLHSSSTSIVITIWYVGDY